MSTIPSHHLYSIHIFAIIPRRVVDAFGSRFRLSFMLAVCFLLPLLLLELGRRLRCREQTAQVSRLFSFFLP